MRWMNHPWNRPNNFMAEVKGGQGHALRTQLDI